MERSDKTRLVRPVPEGFHTVTPYLCIQDAAGFIRFVEKAFDGKKIFEMKGEGEKIMHATVSIGNSRIMVADATETVPAQPGILYLYVEDADRLFQQALVANATVVQEIIDQFYGDRTGAVKDAWGNVWWIATQVEEVDPREMERRTRAVLQERKERGHEVHA